MVEVKKKIAVVMPPFGFMPGHGYLYFQLTKHIDRAGFRHVDRLVPDEHTIDHILHELKRINTQAQQQDMYGVVVGCLGIEANTPEVAEVLSAMTIPVVWITPRSLPEGQYSVAWDFLSGIDITVDYISKVEPKTIIYIDMKPRWSQNFKELFDEVWILNNTA